MRLFIKMPKIRSRDKRKLKRKEAICNECNKPFYKYQDDIDDDIFMIEHRTAGNMSEEDKEKLNNMCNNCNGQFIRDLLCEQSRLEFWRDFKDSMNNKSNQNLIPNPQYTFFNIINKNTSSDTQQTF